MVASKHMNAGASFGYGGSFASVTAGGHRSVEQLLTGAEELLIQAPDAALALGEHAVALAETYNSQPLWIRAESLVVSARVRLGYRASTVKRGLQLLRFIEKTESGQRSFSRFAARLKVDLAVCARSVHHSSASLVTLRSALSDGELPVLWRISALTNLVGCLAYLGPKGEFEGILSEAEQLCVNAEELSSDQKCLVGAFVRNASSGYRRRNGDLDGAIKEAKAGIDLLTGMTNSAYDGAAIQARLVLNTVCALLDRGELNKAIEVAQPIVSVPVRASFSAPSGWLKLALATRALFPNGASAAALSLVHQAAREVNKELLPGLYSRLTLELAGMQEQLGDSSAALESLRSARLADQLHRDQRQQARELLTEEFGDGAKARQEFEQIFLTGQSSAGESPSMKVGARTSANNGHPQMSAKPKKSSVPDRLSTWKFSVDPALSRVVDSTAWLPRESAENKPDKVAKTSENITRHDAAHGSVAAQSVLDRLGVDSNLTGGKRRAAHDAAADVSDKGQSVRPSAVASVDFSRFLSGDSPSSDSRSDSPSGDEFSPSGENTEAKVTEAKGTDAKVTRDNGFSKADRAFAGGFGRSAGISNRDEISGNGSAVPSESPIFDEWLPRLRLPPSLAPIESFDDQTGATGVSRATSASKEEGLDTSDLPLWKSAVTARFDEFDDNFVGGYGAGSGYDKAIAAEDPPADAGLADLLARALAEHRAGTSSAAALVRRLGEQNNARGTSQRVNGHARTETRANGRHREEA